ncbi:vegetative cell wall protein gp1-like [Vulpes lagopus]|uniref:vegetative cell wall protein gp1-like n=1 Tax=Vulpes lagopus TaxID=494514 RepID=UPI001BC8C9DD|nr:vegetative cell wall protein gp1-like [Vulpes lagopus]
MAYTILKVHRKRLLKLPLEGLREFLQDSLAQPWALEDEAVLRHLRASMTQLRRMRCDLPPPAGPEEFPTRPLGLEPVSPAPGPLLPSPASEPPPRVEEPASPGPVARPEPPGPPPGQAIIKPPPQRWNSLPTLPYPNPFPNPYPNPNLNQNWNPNPNRNLNPNPKPYPKPGPKPYPETEP